MSEYGDWDRVAHEDDETRWQREEAAEASWERNQRRLDDRDRDLPMLTERAVMTASPSDQTRFPSGRAGMPSTRKPEGAARSVSSTRDPA